MNEYGTIRIKLEEMLKKRGMSKNKLPTRQKCKEHR